MSLAVFGIYKAKVSVELDLEVQNILQEITVAVSWNQLEAALKAFFGLFEFETEEEGEETSVLVKQAKKLIRKYYDQGITLEEIANKLYVSEEYLSAQFKKRNRKYFYRDNPQIQDREGKGAAFKYTFETESDCGACRIFRSEIYE